MFALLTAAVLSIRHSMQGRRTRAEQAWRSALLCQGAHASQPDQCSASLLSALDAAQDIPEHAARELELAAALHGLSGALHSARAVERVQRAGAAFGWRAP